MSSHNAITFLHITQERLIWFSHLYQRPKFPPLRRRRRLKRKRRNSRLASFRKFLGIVFGDGYGGNLTLLLFWFSSKFFLAANAKETAMVVWQRLVCKIFCLDSGDSDTDLNVVADQEGVAGANTTRITKWRGVKISLRTGGQGQQTPNHTQPPFQHRQTDGRTKSLMELRVHH